MRAYGSDKQPGTGWFFNYYPRWSKLYTKQLRKRARREARRETDAYLWGSDASARGWRHT